jgi:hypothetical protein
MESGRALPHSKTLARKPWLALVQGRKARQRDVSAVLLSLFHIGNTVFGN